MATFRTRLRCVGRVYCLSLYAFLGKLIARLELQRRIRPPTNLLSKVLALFQRSFSDIAKVFEHDHPSIRLNGVLSQGLRGNMHKLFRNGPFAVCQSLKKAMGRPGTYGLNLTPSSPDTFSLVVKFSARKEEGFIIGGVRGNKHTLDARIHSNDTALLSRFRDVFFVAQKQVQFIFDLFKFRVLPRICRSYARVIQGNAFTPKGDTFPRLVEVPFPYQRDHGVLKDCQFPSFVGLGRVICSCNLLADTAGKLRRKLELITKDGVMGFGDAIRVQLFGVEDDRREPVKGLDIILDYCWGLRGAINFDFSSSDSFHGSRSYVLP
jgi:hypothetical protein